MPVAAGRPRAHPGYRPETGGFLSHDCLLRTAPGWQLASPEQANQRVRMRGQPKRETTVFLLPNTRSDTHHFCLSFIDQSKVDKSTEQWLNTIESRLEYKKWYCGHYHTEKKIDRIQFMFTSINEFTERI